MFPVKLSNFYLITLISRKVFFLYILYIFIFLFYIYDLLLWNINETITSIEKRIFSENWKNDKLR